MRLVIVESPFAGDVERNIAYARAAVRDAVLRGEAPIASHLLYTQPGILDDEVPAERQLGIDAGLAWRAVAEASVVYTDLGISKGMEYGIDAARSAGLAIEFRTIPGFSMNETNMTCTRDENARDEMLEEERRSAADAWIAEHPDKIGTDYLELEEWSSLMGFAQDSRFEENGQMLSAEDIHDAVGRALDRVAAEEAHRAVDAAEATSSFDI